MATATQIRNWLERGKTGGASHVIIVCDTYDHDDYPVFVLPSEDAKTKSEQYWKMPMQRVMEVYNLSMDLDEQLAKYRVFNY